MNTITIEQTTIEQASNPIDHPRRHPTEGTPSGRALLQPLASAALTIPLLFGLSGCDNAARLLAKPEPATTSGEQPKVAAQSAPPATAPAHNPLTDWIAGVFGQPPQRPAAPEAKPKIAAQPAAPEAAPEPPPAPIPAPQEKPKPGKLYEWEGQGRKLTRIVINTDEQKARFYVGDEQVGWTTVASGLSKYPTPAGHFEVIEKAANKRSNLYGKVLGKGGRVISSNAKAGTGQFPEGARFEGASMPYYMRLTYDGVGLHAGPIPHPGRPASHGCIRLPSQLAPVLFEHVNIGTKVSIVGAGPDYGNYAAKQRAQAAERQVQAQQRRETEERARAQASTEAGIKDGALVTEIVPNQATPKLAMADPFVDSSAAPASPPAARPRERTTAAPAPRRPVEAAVSRPKVTHRRPAPAAKPAGIPSKDAVAQAEPVPAAATPSQDQAAPSPAQATPAANPAPNAPATQPAPTIAKAEQSPANPGQNTAPQAVQTPVQPAPAKTPAPQAKPAPVATVNPPSPPAAPTPAPAAAPAAKPQVVAEAPAAPKPAAAPAPAQPANSTPDKPSGT